MLCRVMLDTGRVGLILDVDMPTATRRRVLISAASAALIAAGATGMVTSPAHTHDGTCYVLTHPRTRVGVTSPTTRWNVTPTGPCVRPNPLIHRSRTRPGSLGLH